MRNKILLVDDDAGFRTEFRECIDEYDILEASSAEEALDILRKPNEIDLVILDVRMPGMSGTEMLGHIKRLSPGLGIIILTAHSSENTAIEALKGRADEYIKKPFNIYRTKETIERLLDSKAVGANPAGGIEDKVDKARRFADRNSLKKVRLSDAAYAVSLSPKYLSRVFKEKMGVRFSEYRIKLKLKEAKELLRSTGRNIDEIAAALGYGNTESFIRMFKSRVGMTPSAFRKGLRAKRRKPKRAF